MGRTLEEAEAWQRECESRLVEVMAKADREAVEELDRVVQRFESALRERLLVIVWQASPEGTAISEIISEADEMYAYVMERKKPETVAVAEE